MNTLEKIVKIIKNLINRLRGKPKRTPKKILQSHGRSVGSYTPQKIYSPPVEKEVVENISMQPQSSKFQYETPPEEFKTNFVIDVKDNETLENFLGKLNDFSNFEKFLEQTPLQWVNVRLDRSRAAIKKISSSPDFNDDELNFKLAKHVRKIAENMLEILQNSSTSTNLDDDSRQNLKNLVEQYLDKIGVDKENFQRGDSFDDWAALSMSNSFQLIATDNPNLVGKIDDIEIQPRIIFYVSETGDVEKIIFGGLCKAYKFSKAEN